jgi:glycolate oxidase iron-sulfur subunit
LLDRKLKHIVSTKADVVATGNPGCLAHMANGIRRENLPVRLVHPITLLAEAYRAGGQDHIPGAGVTS